MSKEQTPKCYSDVKYDTSKCAGFSVGDCCQIAKEQTPITAEEWSINGDGAESTYWLSVFFAGSGKSDKLADVFEIMEQYANAKVLEALEREVPKAWQDGWNNGLSESRDIDLGFFHQGTKTKEEYYETEVKPRYKD